MGRWFEGPAPVRRGAWVGLLTSLIVATAGLGTAGATGMAWTGVAWTGAARAATAGAATGAAPEFRTVLGPGQVASPEGLALDDHGDLFVADTDHCRVLVLAPHATTFDGISLRAGRPETLVGGSCHGADSIGHPTGLAVDRSDDVFIAEATAQRVQEVRGASHRPLAVTVVGDGHGGYNGDGLSGTATELNQPIGVAVDAAGDLYVADTANCRVRILAARSGTVLGRAVTAGHVSTIAGTGVCGSAGQGAGVAGAQLWDPVAVAVDAAGDLVVADRGDQSVLVASPHGGSFYGTPIGADDIGVVVGGTGTYGPYVADGLPATGVSAELNDPRGLAVGPTGALFVTDGFMHAMRVVPATTGSLLGRMMQGGSLYTAVGAVPVSSSSGLGNGTTWLGAHVGTVDGVAVSDSGTVYYSDAALDQVRAIVVDTSPTGAGGGSP